MLAFDFYKQAFARWLHEQDEGRPVRGEGRARRRRESGGDHQKQGRLARVSPNGLAWGFSPLRS
jgi:hypothetical protein